MHHALRRTAIIVASSAVVLSGAPLLGTASATSTLTQSSVTPTNASTVKDSHPAISAGYTDGGNPATLDSSSTITVTGGPTTVACDSNGTVSGNTITCNYPSTTLLKSGTYTITVDAVEASNTANTAHNTSTFTVNVPTISSATPPVNGRVQSASSVSVTYNQSIDDANSKITVQQIADKTGTNTYTPASHTPLTGTTTFIDSSTGQPATLPDMSTDSNTNDTIVFTPTSPPVNKGIYQVTLDVFGTDGASNGVTTPDGPNLKAESKDTYTFTMDDPIVLPAPPAPTNLAESPNPVTSANKTTVTFSGNGTPGDTIVVDATDGTHHFNNSGTNNGGPVTVPTCPSTTSCAWSKVFDYTSSGLNEGTITWTATETAAQNSTSFTGSSTPASGPSFAKDTTAPASPHVAGSFTPSNSTQLTVTGSSDSTVDQYKIDIHDSASPTAHTIPTITLTKAHGDINADGTFTTQVDVSSLDDGQLFLTLVAIDAVGNTSGQAFGNATKAVGLVLDFNHSFFKQSNSDTPSFPTVLNRPNHGVQPLSQIAIEFSNPLTLHQTDSNQVQPKSFDAPDPYFVEVLSNGADGNTFAGTRAISSTDNRQLLVTPPPGLADGTYKLHITVYQGPNDCSFNSAPPPIGTGATQGTCNTYDDWVKVPNTSTPFTFTVDSVPPSTPVISTPSGTINGTNVGDVVIGGTAGGGASFVALTAKSSGGGSVLVLNGGQPVSVDSDGNWQDDESDGAFAALADGTITISATASDGAGNTSSTTTHTVVLAARPSIPRSLAVSETSSSFTLHWAAPSYDGYPAQNGNPVGHLTGYRYTYQDKTSGAVDTSVHTVTIGSAAATSATQAGLLTGHSYAVTLCALNDVNTGPCNMISTTVVPAFLTSLTESINHTVVVYGNSIILSGRLTRADTHTPLSGQALTIQPRYDNGTTGTVIHVTTNSAGNYSATISKPAKNALYVVSYNATHSNPLYQPAMTSVRSLVAAYLNIDTVRAASSSHTSPVTISGHIAPNEAGRSVLMYVKVAGGTQYQRLGYVKISSSSTWSLVHTFAVGRYYVIATFGSQNGVTAGHSQTVTITRT